ncbi:AzlD domain-containing protein [Holzapfeliella sp. He02]|uniref:AzlD domain-containing protein n=1 Tax=Holzapfeliella saturejae TaxID=3082953 RepID=A0ABU8SES5_9LACO
MPSTNFVILTIFLCGFVTWCSRALPFAVLKKVNLPDKAIEFLNFVPIVIMSALWFENLFIQRLGQLPELNIPNLLASIPTLLAAIFSKSLLITVVVGIISLGLIQLI